MIERDHGRGSIVVVCRGCGARDLVNTPVQAARWEDDHLARHLEIARRDEATRRAVAAAAERRRSRDTRGNR